MREGVSFDRGPGKQVCIAVQTGETVAGAHKHVLHKDFTYSLIQRMLRMKVPCAGSVPEHSEPPYCLHRQHPNQNNTSKVTHLERSTCAENHMKPTEKSTRNRF